MENQIKQIVGDILDLDPQSITAATARDKTPSWDSLHHINLISALEEEFSIVFDVDEIESLSTFGGIVQLIQRKLE